MEATELILQELSDAMKVRTKHLCGPSCGLPPDYDYPELSRLCAEVENMQINGVHIEIMDKVMDMMMGIKEKYYDIRKKYSLIDME